MDLPDLAVEALALTIRHLKGFGFERILCSGALRPFVLQNNIDGSESGSLLQIMNQTLTIFGSRLLRHWRFCFHKGMFKGLPQKQDLRIS
ncbi:hypothetical protein P8452_50908 [Trifolium repens]|nr:hypothetical protein P8452_50908 [Trifolium repens]